MLIVNKMFTTVRLDITPLQPDAQQQSPKPLAQTVFSTLLNVYKKYVINNTYAQQNFNAKWHTPINPCMLMPNTKALDHLAKLSL